LKYDSKDKAMITRVKNITKPSLTSLIRLQELKADSKNTAYTGIIRTAQHGLLHSRVALKKKTGGIYLAKVF
jgi:ribosomal protein S8